MPKIFKCETCECTYNNDRGLRKHYSKYTDHRKEKKASEVNYCHFVTLKILLRIFSREFLLHTHLYTKIRDKKFCEQNFVTVFKRKKGDTKLIECKKAIKCFATNSCCRHTSFIEQNRKTNN